MKSTNIEHLQKDRYYEHDCTNSMVKQSQKFMINDKRKNMDQVMNEGGSM